MGGVYPAEVGGGGWEHEIWVILSLRQEFLLRISRERSFVGVLEDEVRKMSSVLVATGLDLKTAYLWLSVFLEGAFI